MRGDKRTTQPIEGKLKEPLSLDTKHPALPVILVLGTADGSFERFTPDSIGRERTKLWTGEKAANGLDRRTDSKNTHTPAMAEGVICWDFYSSRPPWLKRRDRRGAVIVGIIPTGLTLYSEPIVQPEDRADTCTYRIARTTGGPEMLDSANYNGWFCR